LNKTVTLSFILLISCPLYSCSANNEGSESSFTGCAEDYPKQSNSAYILPYPSGSTYIVGQGNCTDDSHSEDQKYAYDFDMPIGTTIIASRAGTVIAAEESFADSTRVSGEENFVLIQHSDGTVAGYFHLTKSGVPVRQNNKVSQGQTVGLSGDSGDSTEPHLHFEVLECEDCDSLPINFRNTRAHTSGLVDQNYYKAL